MTQLNPFHEAIISWNALRPIHGEFFIKISLFTKKWSNFFDYAIWGNSKQCTFKYECKSSKIKITQDVIEILDGNATGFRISVSSQNSSSLGFLRSLFISLVNSVERVQEVKLKSSIFIPIEGLSQMTLKHPVAHHLCSPTSTVAVLRYLLNKQLCTLEFARDVLDSPHQCYGNWVLNVAQASHLLGEEWECYVQRWCTFEQVFNQLINKIPVVVSIQGPLKKSAQPYLSGHLMVIIGYNVQSNMVICMDPAFPKNELTYVEYSFDNFIAAWERKKRLAYIFQRAK